MKKEMIGVFVFVVVIAFFAGMIAGSKLVEQNMPQVSSKPIMEEQLINWVYSKSERISKYTCKVIVQEAMKTKYPLLMLALIEMESNFTPTALSNKGAMGLTQVMPKYHRKNLIKEGIITTDRDLFNISASIKAGDMILGEYLSQTSNDVSKALGKYLGGKDGVYVKRIQANLANLYILIHTG